jgi:hypothetical protein
MSAWDQSGRSDTASAVAEMSRRSPGGTGPGLALECDVDGAARRRFCLDRVAGFEAAEIVPQADAAPEQDRDDGDVQAVDKPALR